jgi:signal transduction histidine kinase
MSFMVQDLLDYAQIKANKFRKVLKTFNIRESVERVMCIQRKKAQEQTIEFYPEFVNIGQDEND